MLLDVAQQQVQIYFKVSCWFSSLYPESVRHFKCVCCFLSQEADELIVGLPVSADGRETPQSNKVRSVVGRLAVQAAERCVSLRTLLNSSVHDVQRTSNRGCEDFWPVGRSVHQSGTGGSVFSTLLE